MELQQVPDWGTIPRMLRDRAAGHPDVEVVVAGDTRLTLAALAGRAAEVARALLALGVAPGDRVSIWAPNTPGWVVTAYGLWDAGAVIAPLSTRFKGIEAVEMLRKAGTRVLVVDEGFLDVSYLALLDQAAGGPGGGRPFAGLPDLRQVISYGSYGPLDEAMRLRPGVLSWEEFLAGRSATAPEDAERRALAVRPGDLAEVMATSGTTGIPKGVMLEHAQLLRAYWDWAEIVTLGEGDRYPIIAPFSHGFGINAGLLAGVLRRATLMPVALFAPAELMRMVERDRVSVLAGAPPLFFRILEEYGAAPGKWDVSALRVAICGAAAVPPDLIRRLLDEVGLERMINAYGLMEGTVVSMTRAADPVEVIAGSAGRAVPGVAVRIVDDDGKDLPPGEPGEILVGGYGVMRGYWEDPGKTAEAIDAAGWLRTGDVGTLDGRGNVTIVDRKKEMFIVGGFNAYPAEIEGLLLRCAGVAQAAVIGVPDERLGEVGRAYVVPRTGVDLDPGEVIAWARENMSNYKVPRTVVVVDALPVNRNGKIDKPRLRARAANET